MPLISVLLPSRGRPDSLRRSVTGLYGLADLPDRVEVLVAADPDDPATAATARSLGVAVWEAPERFGYARLHEYFNLLAGKAAGEWLLEWNDDADMRTAGWDTVLAELPPEVMVADLQTTFSPHLCCFPAVRRSAVEAIGAFSPVTPHCDTWLQDIGRATGTIRPVDIHVHHDRADITGGHQDQTRAEALAGYRSADFYGPTVQAALAAAAEKVRALL